jgi:Protein of unknown function (DUF3179)
MLYFNLCLLIIIFFNFHIMGQTAMDNILKAYPKWTTNFEKKSIDLNELLSGGPPKDGIPAIVNPKFTTQDEATNWLDNKEPVIAVNMNGMSKAYPLQILIFHEIVNDRIGSTPLLISFCPLCYSGIVFNRTVNGMAVNFGVSGLLRNSDMVMYDQLSESFWQQFTGEAIVGDQTGTQLEIIPSQIISFEQFMNNYPDGLILSKNTGFKRPYGMTPYTKYDSKDALPFLFNGKKDSRLPQNEKVIGIKMDSLAKAYPYSITSKKKVINDKVGQQEIVLFHIPGTFSSLDQKYINESKDVGSTGVFYRNIDNYQLTFKYENDKIIDKQTQSVWSITGQCINGELKTKQLKKTLYGDYFSFAWFAFRPNSLIYLE